MTNISSISLVAVWGVLLSAGCSSSDKSASAPAEASAGSPDSRPTVGAATSGTGGRAVTGGSGTSTSASTDAGQRPRDASQPSADAARPATDAARPAEGSQSGDDASTSTETPGSTAQPPADAAYDAYLADPKLTWHVFAAHLDAARQMAFASNGDLFVNNGKFTVLWDANRDGVSRDGERATFGEASGLNHGRAFDHGEKFLYASSDTTVFRFAYTPGAHAASGSAQVVVSGIPTGGHSTRTLIFDEQNRLYVSVGSGSNVDTADRDLKERSLIRRFAIPESLPATGMAYSDGTVIASGMRNEVGLFIDSDKHLWGVENGRDNLSDADLGGDIHNDNPGEELNLIEASAPTFYGYPLCFSEYKVAAGGQGPRAQWADESLPRALRKDDAYCQDATQVRPPAAVMPSHWAPLGVVRYSGTLLPFHGDLLIGAHGSWNRQPAVGRVIARAPVQGTTVGEITTIVAERGSGTTPYKEGSWDVRPVDLREAADGTLFCSDDAGGRIFRLGYSR
jgi:glucose/arabinose dehydrogenase